MSNIENEEDGGPVFPVVNPAGEWVQSSGMSLRDYFAAKSMQAEESRSGRVLPAIVAQRAYEIADAMIQARGR